MEWLDVNGASLRYELSGDGQRPLILIHELGGALDSYDDVMATLRSHFRILRYDQRGAGLSEKTPVLTLTMVLDDLHSLTTALSFTEPAAVVGTALGGGYAIAYAAKYPDRVSRLVATSPATGVTGQRGKGLLQRAELVTSEGMRAAVDASLSLSYPDSLRDDKARYERYRNRWITNDPMSFAALNVMLANADMDWIFEQIQCPSLILGATRDPIRTPATVKELAARIADSIYREVDAGHFMAMQSPALFL
ncbi:MAG: alpha/beta fold hydrolase, partial [Chromatiales bacterium]|nr:alpha/beta fold hydrolase [Chromatiales bacterium]